MRKRKPLKSKSKIPDGKKFKDKYQVSSIIDSLKEIKRNKTLTENQKNKLVSELLKNLKE
jgi:hypothetical protein